MPSSYERNLCFAAAEDAIVFQDVEQKAEPLLGIGSRATMRCPICGWQGVAFLPKNHRENVLCPKCGSFERHRHQFFAAASAGVLGKLSESCVLHIGPEHCEALLLGRARFYVALDLRASRAAVVGDLVLPPFCDGSFDLVWASHVLEHIRNVNDAVREVYRVLKPSGMAMLDVPMYGRETAKLAQPDRYGHIWHPGDDWPAVYVRAGFTIQLFMATDCPRVYGPLAGSVVAVCWKPEPTDNARE